MCLNERGKKKWYFGRRGYWRVGCVGVKKWEEEVCGEWMKWGKI